jgi:hypothetical protein
LGRVEFCHYWWGGGLPSGVREAAGWGEDGDGGENFFDVIIASDDLYDDKAFPPLLESLKVITGPRTLIVFAYKRRMNSREIGFFEKIEEAFDLGVVDLDVVGCEPYTETYIALAGIKGGAVAEWLRGKGAR